MPATLRRVVGGAGSYATSPPTAFTAATTLRMVIGVAPNTPANAKVTRTVTATSVTDPAAVDAVKATVQQGHPPESTDPTAEVSLELTPETLSAMASVLVCALE